MPHQPHDGSPENYLNQDDFWQRANGQETKTLSFSRLDPPLETGETAN